MRGTCPDCGAQAHVAAFFVEDEGKRLAGLLADMEPALGRAVIGYLGLFKPPKTSLRLARAVKIVEELRALVATGAVCNDERSGVRRPASSATWATGIEQMLAQRASLTLPLGGHGYLRQVVYGLADKADAAAERRREADARVGKHLHGASEDRPSGPQETPFQRQLEWIAHQVRTGGMSDEEADAARAEAEIKWGAA